MCHLALCVRERVRVGKLIMSACFVTDMCTVIALSVIFIKPSVWFPVFLVVSVALVLLLPKLAPWFFGRYGDRVIEPEIKLVFVVLFALMVLGSVWVGVRVFLWSGGLSDVLCCRWAGLLWQLGL